MNETTNHPPHNCTTRVEILTSRFVLLIAPNAAYQVGCEVQIHRKQAKQHGLSRGGGSDELGSGQVQRGESSRYFLLLPCRSKTLLDLLPGITTKIRRLICGHDVKILEYDACIRGSLQKTQTHEWHVCWFDGPRENVHRCSLS